MDHARVLRSKPPGNRSVLPIDAVLPQILTSLARHPNLVIVAAPGAGKTTRMPPALLGAVAGGVIVLEPRRIAARLAARRVAEEMGQRVGETCGYQVRFEEVVGPRTRLRFVTEGVLTRRLLTDPQLVGISAVVLDEFHERHLDADLALALLKRLQRSRPDLRIIVMSATVESDSVAKYLGNCPAIRAEGRLFELDVHHLPYSPEPLEVRVCNAAERLLSSDNSGHVLIFLPGAAEIRAAMRECEPIARRANAIALPLHGALSPEEQDRAVASSTQRKLIFATNVAETSITVDGVTAVIDSGLARVASYSAWTGLPTLHIARVSKASARQRAGRAGRTAPGRVLRLYPEEDYLRRPDHDAPEIMRADLSQLCLSLRAMGIPHANDLEWLDAPTTPSLESAEALLDRLGATGSMAQRMARFPLHPRLSRILVEAMERGVGEDGCVAAALIGSNLQSRHNDLLAAMEHDRSPQLQREIRQLRTIARVAPQKRHDDNALLLSVLTGFPDRVARLRAGKQVLLSTGTSAEIAGTPPPYEFMVAVDAEHRKEKPLPLVRMTARIEPEWLLDHFPDRVHEQSEVIWNSKAERVDAVSALLYDSLVLQESRGAVPDPEAAAELLANKALEAGIERFVDVGELNAFLARVEFAGITAPDVPSVMRNLCRGLRRFAELKTAAANVITLLEQNPGVRQLKELAPTHIRLRTGRTVKVHYERGKPPWIASRLQDFFGMHETPRIGRDRTPVVVHLLAPNQRPVQTTTDLAGFWDRLYPQVRRELMRRYPKHAWPEKL